MSDFPMVFVGILSELSGFNMDLSSPQPPLSHHARVYTSRTLNKDVSYTVPLPIPRPNPQNYDYGRKVFSGIFSLYAVQRFIGL